MAERGTLCRERHRLNVLEKNIFPVTSVGKTVRETMPKIFLKFGVLHILLRVVSVYAAKYV
jgi:hypothetical protein